MSNEKKPTMPGDDVYPDIHIRQREEFCEICRNDFAFHQKLHELFAASLDYDKDSHAARQTLRIVKNKLYYAAAYETADEVLAHRADSGEKNMGLFTWAGAPDGEILESDAVSPGNYLDEHEAYALGSMFFNFCRLAEDLARRGIPVRMEHWADRVNAFMQISRRETLTDEGSVSAEEAIAHAKREFAKYAAMRDGK